MRGQQCFAHLASASVERADGAKPARGCVGVKNADFDQSVRYTLMWIDHCVRHDAAPAVGTPHLDGNTRLCTATAEWALVESFGVDGDPGSYADITLAPRCCWWYGTTWPRRRWSERTEILM